MNDFNSHIVIDTGSATIKAGFNAEDAPRCVIPSVVGREPADSVLFPLDDEKQRICGHKVFDKYYDLDLVKPVKGGRITDFDAIEDLWEHIFSAELKVSPEAFSVFLTESLLSSEDQRNEVAEIMFENFSIFNLHIQPQPCLSIYTSAKTSGLVVECGHGLTQIVPIYEGYVLNQGIRVSELAGEFIEEKLGNMLRRQLNEFKVSNSDLIIRDIKEKHGRIGEYSQFSYELPDGNSLDVNGEVEHAFDSLFNPREGKSINQHIIESVESLDINLKSLMYQSVILGGGTSITPGFSERIEKSVKANTTPKVAEKVEITSSPEQIYSSWLGAAVLCSFGTFKQMWVSKSDYEEHGDKILNRNYC